MTEHFGFTPGRRPPPEAGRPLYTLITIVRNAAATIESTLRSVSRQTYPAIEYIVVDAGSTDGTVDILRRHEHLISHWCSEPDQGHADGQNKGVAIGQGTFIGFVYADDWLPDDFVERAVGALTESGADFVFGDMAYYMDEEYLFTIHGDPDYRKRITYRAPVMNYPTLTACRRVFETAGVFNPAYKVAPDYEWLFRVHHAGFNGKHDPAIRYHFALGGNSSQHATRCVLEVARALCRLGANPLRVWGYAAVRIAFYAVDERIRRSVSPAVYARVRAVRKAISG
ncbi:glycosyltransferase family 2 protein [Elstera litoralis]|uniref:glycosyltransferase family 2 protein n=1 Tax=Elstera litoralis TaxID=552518 RepID=UPI0006973F44|nr:glycosyltransferase family 2 protein [Elstera litoralis]